MIFKKQRLKLFSDLPSFQNFLACFVCILFMATLSVQASAKGNPRYAAIVMDADTGLILHESNPDKRLYPASLTKIMTLLMVFEGLNRGTLGLNDTIRMSRHAASMEPSKLNIPVGSSIKVKDAILGLVTKSANDVAAAVAEHLGKTESNFAKMMTARAREIGMKNTTFKNASGLPHPDQISTVRDMAILGRFIYSRYPQQYKYFSTRNFVYQGKAYHNHNRLMESYKGMDGIKTGFIGASGFNLVASATRNNRRLIGVVFGGRTTHSRNARMAELLDEGFARLQKGQGKPGAPLVAQAQPQFEAAYQQPALADKTQSADIDFGVPLPERKPSVLAAYSNPNTRTPTPSLQPKPNVIGSSLRPILKPPASAGVEQATSQRLRLKMPQPAPTSKESPSYTLAMNDPSWAVQVGAFASRVQTDRAIGAAFIRLPESLRHANPIIIPLKQGENWLFRGRLSGFTREQALAACAYIDECIPVGPRS